MDITMNDFLSHRKGLRDFYKQNLPHLELAAAGKVTLKLGDLSRHPRRVTLPSGAIVNYGVAMCMACVESIDMRYPRKNHLTEEDKQFIAERMEAKYKYWTVCDLKCFEDMLIMGRIPTVRYGGTEYELPGVSIPSLLSKAESYDRMRPSCGKGADSSVPDSMAALVEQRSVGWRRSPFNIYSDYHKTHDCHGNLVVDPAKFGGTPPDDPGWEYESHWDQWYRTHLADGTPAPKGFDPIAYWKEGQQTNKVQLTINHLTTNLRPDGV
jgi:hypothetical protein